MKYKLFPLILCITLFSCQFQKKGNASTPVKEVDICIYGGTSAGVVAAYSAKKMGKSVLLVEPGKYLGGMTTGGLGATDIGNKYAVTGLAAFSIAASESITINSSNGISRPALQPK